MLNIKFISEKLIEFISDSYLDGNDKVDENTELTKLNIVDSSSIFDVVDFIYNEFRIKMPLEEINAENFSCISALSERVFKLNNLEIR